MMRKFNKPKSVAFLTDGLTTRGGHRCKSSKRLVTINCRGGGGKYPRLNVQLQPLGPYQGKQNFYEFKFK